MPQSLAKVAIHIVFSTKRRTPWLKDSDTRGGLYAYVAGTLKGCDSPAIVIGGTEDHVHILCLLSRSFPIKRILEEVKKASSKWIKNEGPEYRDFYWQSGYGVFSVSESKVPEVKQYILKQEEHHRKISYQEEFRAFCERCGVSIDERYVWD